MWPPVTGAELGGPDGIVCHADRRDRKRRLKSQAGLAAEDNPDAAPPADPEQGQAINAIPLLGEVAKGMVKRIIGRKSEE